MVSDRNGWGKMIEKGGGDWGSVITESDAECSERVMAESEGEWIAKSEQALWDVGFEKWKAYSIFQLPSYAIINDHFLIGKVHVCYASVVKGWI